MARKIRPAPTNGPSYLKEVKRSLSAALDWATLAECPQLAKKIRSALKSHGGAVRHMERRKARG